MNQGVKSGAQPVTELIPSATEVLQPFLNREEVVIVAPTQVWSSSDGDYGSAAIHGLYHADWRLVSSGRLRVDGAPVETAGVSRGERRLTVHSVARSLDDNTPDPRVVVRWERSVVPGQVTESVRVLNGLDEELVAPVELAFRIDFAPMQDIKAGLPVPVACEVRRDDDAVLASDGVRSLRISANSGRLEIDGNLITATVLLTVPARAQAEFRVELQVADTDAVVGPGQSPIAELPPTGDAALDRWAGQAVADCRALLLDAGQGAFVAAGTPWFLTLFGRDSLIAARFLLPLSVELAYTTLLTLAARQGTVTDDETGEQPGKIMHELRADVLELPGEGTRLPPVYYGTTDATALWIILLHDAWRAGLPEDAVADLFPTLRCALVWLRDHALVDGFLRYQDTSGHGLANQGWKDSGDSVRYADGTLATGPIALSEVQAQACLAVENGAALLEAFGENGSAWREFADGLRERFRAAFWVERDGDRFPAIALDGAGRPADTKTSNIGQLIGTTLLSPEEERVLADLLIEPRFASGYGLRTMADDESAYWPLSYHCGSVWTHDTAMAIDGLLRVGLTEHARILARQLVRAADAFGSRMPELFAGYGADEVSAPVAYPASCRPQGWAAAAVVPVHRALAGL